MKSLFLFASMEHKLETSPLQMKVLALTYSIIFEISLRARITSHFLSEPQKQLTLQKTVPFFICLKYPPNSLLWSTRVIKSIPTPSNKEASSLPCVIPCFCLRFIQSPWIPLAFQDAENSSGIISKSALSSALLTLHSSCTFGHFEA